MKKTLAILIFSLSVIQGYAQWSTSNKLEIKFPLDGTPEYGPGQRNVLLKLGHAWNPSPAPGKINIAEPSLLFDNGTTGLGAYGTYGWSVGARVAGTGYFRIAQYINGTFSEYLRIQQNGVIIIGNRSQISPLNTATQAGNDNTELSNAYSLYVPKGIRTEVVKVDLTSAPWSDFVFDKDYKLSSLEEVEQFIFKNHHLPEIPSAKEVKDNGINVAEMDAKLLQKIEELTLYMIELKKENEILKKQNENVILRVAKLEK